MKRRLQLIGIACALIVGGWAGVFAAVVCPHAGSASSGAASHDCCRGADGDGAGCPMKLAEPGGDHHQRADRRQQKADGAHGAAESHGASHASEEPQAVHAPREEPRAVVAAESVSVTGRAGAFERRSDFCAHCVGSRLPPPSSNRLSAPEAARRGDSCAAPRAEKLPAPSSFVFAREVIPAQGAPPGAARLHILNSVFLI